MSHDRSTQPNIEPVGSPTMVQRAESALARLDTLREKPSIRFVIVFLLLGAAGAGWWFRSDTRAEPVDHRIEMVSVATSETSPGSPSGTKRTTVQGLGATSSHAVASGPDPVHDVVVVHVAGEVVHPGIVTLAAGDRVVDAIEAAGGVTPEADMHKLNLAAVLVDGYRIHVPKIGEQVSPPGGGVDGTSSADGLGNQSGPININRATVAELETLNGIGPALAQAIVSWRDEHGMFGRAEDLLSVPGIGPSKLANIIDRIHT